MLWKKNKKNNKEVKKKDFLRRVTGIIICSHVLICVDYEKLKIIICFCTSILSPQNLPPTIYNDWQRDRSSWFPSTSRLPRLFWFAVMRTTAWLIASAAAWVYAGLVPNPEINMSRPVGAQCYRMLAAVLPSPFGPHSLPRLKSQQSLRAAATRRDSFYVFKIDHVLYGREKEKNNEIRKGRKKRNLYLDSTFCSAS